MQDINEQLDEAIAKKDIPSIRIILTTSMVQDPGFVNRVFENRLKRVRESGIFENEVFEPFSGDEIIENSLLWTKDYYAKARTDFLYNFSQERLTHLRKVGQKLYPAAAAFDGAAQKKNGDSPGERIPSPQRIYSPCGKDEGIPGWIVPAAIAAAAVILLGIIFGRK
jgi:hypothetical protein